MILACLGQRQILKLGVHLNPQKKQFFDMKTRTLLMSSLFAAAVAFAQTPEKTKSATASANFTLIGTYGKTWHMWQVDRGDKLPLGIPQLMMAFTADGQAKANIIADRDKLYGSTAAKKMARADIADAKHDPSADGWQKGAAVQLDLKTVQATVQ